MLAPGGNSHFGGRGRDLGPNQVKEGTKMYSYEDQIKAVHLFEQYGKRATAVIRDQGYPDRHMLAKQYQEYVSNGDLKKFASREPKYYAEQKATAVEFYLSH